MEFFLLCLSLLGTTQARIPLRSSNSTVLSSGQGLNTSKALSTAVGGYIAAGLSLSSSETHTSLASTDITSSTSNVPQHSETIPVSTSTSSMAESTSSLETSSTHSPVQHGNSTVSIHAQKNTESSLTPKSFRTSRHVPVIALATALSSTAATSDDAPLPTTKPTSTSRGVFSIAANSSAPTTTFRGTDTPKNSSSTANATQVSQCWASWTDYWNLEETTQYTLYTGTDTWTVYTYSDYFTTYEYTTTSTEYNGNFPTATDTETILTTDMSLSTLSAIETDVNTWTRSGAVSTTITTPPCVLPSSVSQCQTSWEVYYSWLHPPANVTPTTFMDTPQCTQADITGALCSTAISDWLESIYGYDGGEVSGRVGVTTTYINVTSTSRGSIYTTSTPSTYWPTSTTIVPGCTLGCQSCRVSGNQVKLLYWPPETSSAPGLITTTAYGTTLTSPTVYISFDSLWALNSCSDVGTPMANVIVPITNTAAMSSIYGWGRWWADDYLSASFNFTDLYVTPVPDEIYASQPRCASSAIGIEFSCLGQQSPIPPICTEKYPCARTLPYEPVISVPAEVQNLQPAWANCIGGLNGVYDPPQALSAAASEALPPPPGPKNGGSTSAQTTHASESSPDATTPAAPSPTATQIASATKASPSPDPIQSHDPNPDPPAQSPTSHTNGDPPAHSPEPQPVNHPQPANSDPANPPAAQASDQQPTEPNSPQNQPAPSAEPSPSNALQVLSQAEASPQWHSSPHDNPNDPQPTEAPDAPAPTTNDSPQGGATWTASDGSVESASKDGSNVVIAAPGSTEVVPDNGKPVTFAGQIISQNGGGLVVDGSSIAVPTAVNTPAAIWTASNSDVVSAVAQGRSIVIGDSQSSFTVAPGANAVFNGQTISAAQTGGAVMVDGSSMVVPEGEPTPAAAPVAVWTAANGDVISAVAQGSNIVVQDGHNTITVPPGSSAVIDGQTITAALNGNAIIADGSTIAMPSAGPADELWTASNGQVFSVITESDGDVEMLGQSTTMLLTPGGSSITFDGQALSAMPNGGGLLVDGSSIALPTAVAMWTAPEGSTISAMPDGSDDIILVEGSSKITIDPQDGATTFDGQTVSALPGGRGVVIDGTTLLISRTDSAESGTSKEGDKGASTSGPSMTRNGVVTAVSPKSTSGATRSSAYQQVLWMLLPIVASLVVLT